MLFRRQIGCPVGRVRECVYDTTQNHDTVLLRYYYPFPFCRTNLITFRISSSSRWFSFDQFCKVVFTRVFTSQVYQTSFWLRQHAIGSKNARAMHQTVNCTQVKVTVHPQLFSRETIPSKMLSMNFGSSIKRLSTLTLLKLTYYIRAEYRGRLLHQQQ